MPSAAPPIVLVIMGVAGTGKSTVAGILAGRLGWDLQEGDDLHPASNVAKMASSQPLTDEDRWPWLAKIAAWIQAHVDSGTPGIVTCSALRRVYRDRLRTPGAAFVHLSGSFEQISALLSSRRGHFMPVSLLESQLDTLEPLEPDENGIVVQLGQLPQEAANEIVERLGLGGVEPPAADAQGRLDS